MKRFDRQHLLVAACLLALATTLAITSAYAQTEIPVPPPPFDVNVVNLPDVRIINTPLEPLPVREVPAFTPFQVDRQFSLGRGEGAIEAVLGGQGSNVQQRVVIEHVTVDASIREGQRVVAYIKIGEINHSLVLTCQTWGNSRRCRASQPIRLYSLWGGPGSVGFALAGIERSSSSGSASFYFTVSGHLVNLP